jgi:hypothetical protein
MKTSFPIHFQRIILCTLMVNSGVLAAPEFSVLHAADGKWSFVGRPVAVVSMEKEIVSIQRESGPTLNTPLSAFAEPDRRQLKQWMDKVSSDPQAALTRRLRAAKEPAVLFVGNSYSFDVPRVFQQLAAAEGRSVRIEQVTIGGRSLAGHVEDPKTLEKIRTGNWDAVVIQEQSLIPSFPAGQRDEMMIPPATKLATLVREAGAVPVLYQTWARRDGDHDNAAVFPDDTFAAMHKRLSDGFAAMHQAVPGMVTVDVGNGWAELAQKGKAAELYAADGSHPSGEGTYLAAAVFFVTLFDEDVTHGLKGVKESGELQKLATKIGRWTPPTFP